MSDLISRKAVNNVIIWYETDGSIAARKALDRIAKIPTVPAIPIPENATNGDVLKRLLYGKAIITEFIHDVNISVNNTVVGQFDMEWWNGSYKRGETE